MTPSSFDCDLNQKEISIKKALMFGPSGTSEGAFNFKDGMLRHRGIILFGILIMLSIDLFHTTFVNPSLSGVSC